MILHLKKLIRQGGTLLQKKVHVPNGTSLSYFPNGPTHLRAPFGREARLERTKAMTARNGNHALHPISPRTMCRTRLFACKGRVSYAPPEPLKEVPFGSCSISGKRLNRSLWVLFLLEIINREWFKRCSDEEPLQEYLSPRKRAMNQKKHPASTGRLPYIERFITG